MLTRAKELSIQSLIVEHDLQDKVRKEMAWPLGEKRVLSKVTFVFLSDIYAAYPATDYIQLTMLLNHKYEFD